MNINYTAKKAKGVILFCLFLSANSLIAQNNGSYKYIITSDICDTCLTYNFNADVLEVNNQYYIISVGASPLISSQDICNVMIFDKELNKIEQIQISGKEGGIDYCPANLFYKNNYFYALGWTNQVNTYCFAKYDENFNLVQPVSLYVINDTLDYSISDIFMTEKEEFMFVFCDFETLLGRLFYIGNNGELLQDIILPRSWLQADMAETDSNYVIFLGSNYIIKFPKDSLENYDTLRINLYELDLPDWVVVVNNQIIYSGHFVGWYDECGEYVTRWYQSVVFLNEDMSIKNRIEFGKKCVYNREGNNTLHYINPDSIYYTYMTDVDEYGNNTISIVNFSSEGQVNFNHTLDIVEDSLSFKYIRGCKALSDGGVLISGRSADNMFSAYSRGFLLYYHPTQKSNNAKNYSTTTNRKLFPNPTTSQFTVTNTENANLHLYNILGKEVFRTYSTEENTLINTNFLPQGMYVLKVVQDDSVSVHKVQVVR